MFSEKLHEFYGMLAFHYSRGEDLSKAEEYLIRAGEEALKSSASTEALDYYQRALQSYNKTHGDNADPDRVAMMEKNIAIALFNKFRWTESVQHMDRVLECWHEKTDHHQSGIICNFIKNALFIVLGIDRLIRKVPPTSHDSEVLDLIYRKGQALAVLDRKQLFFCVLGGFNRAVRIDLAQSPESIGLFIGTAVLLSYLGFSYKLSNRLFDNIKSKISADNTKNLIGFTMAHTISKAFSGDWEKIENYFEDHVDAPIRKGYLMSVAAYLYWYAFVKLEQGELDDVEHFILKLSDIAVSYDFPFAKSNAGLLKAYILIVRRELSEAIAVSYQNMAFVSKMTPESHRLVFTCQAAMAFLLSKDFDKTNDMLKRASEIIESQGNLSKNFLAPYLVARFETDITKLKIAKNINSNAKLASLIADAVRSGNAALVQLRNYAPFMTRILKLKGEFFWTIGKQRKALRWWSKAIKKGEALGARPDLARTYMEIGKRLLEDKSKYKELNGISAQEYLEKAREMFQEMDLQWDLDELKKIEQQF